MCRRNGKGESMERRAYLLEEMTWQEAKEALKTARLAKSLYTKLRVKHTPRIIPTFL